MDEDFPAFFSYNYTSQNVGLSSKVLSNHVIFCAFLFVLFLFLFFFKVFIRPRSILCGHRYPLFCTSDDSAVHEFQSQGGFIITCPLLSLVCNVPQSHLWLPDSVSNLDCLPLRRARYNCTGPWVSKPG